MSPPPLSTAAASVTEIAARTRRGNRRPGLPVREQRSIIIFFGMAIVLAFYTISTAPTVEPPTSQHGLTLQPTASFPRSGNDYNMGAI
jgi:hypothetical protein